MSETPLTQEERAWEEYQPPGPLRLNKELYFPAFFAGFKAGKQAAEQRVAKLEAERDAAHIAAKEDQRKLVKEREYADRCGREAAEFEARLQQATEALRELVRLKHLKDAGDDLAWTQAQKDAAWAAALAALALSPEEKVLHKDALEYQKGAEARLQQATEALEWYANPNNHEFEEGSAKGKRARAALGEPDD